MAFSQKVHTVIGVCCTSRKFRTEFFKNPNKARDVVGTLTSDEEAQLERVVTGDKPAGQERLRYQNDLEGDMDKVYARLNCPMPPCPDVP